MAAALAQTVLGFGPFALDLAGGRLLHHGEEVHLTPKAFALLGLLASRAGELVTKQEIFAALWPRTHVTDFALSRCVRELRATLGDDAHAPRFLATVHRRGLRFVADVVRPEPGSGAELPFVGRERELAAARAWLAQRSAGPIRLLRISGEPGVGKTRLAREIAALARGCGAAVLWSQTPGGEGAPPYDVWRQIFEAQRAQGGAQRTRDARAAIDPRDGRQRAFATVASQLEAMTAQRPALLVLDDLHGADPDSLHLLDHLLQDVDDPRLAIVCTLRDVGAPANELLRATLEAAPGDGRVALALRGLAPAESAALLAARVGRERARRFAAHVHEQSGGNPLYVAELAELVPCDDEASAFGAGLSGTLRGLIASRLALVSPLCADVLTAAAVLGSEAPLAMLREVAELGADALAEGTDEAVAQRLLARPEGLPGHVRFTHGLVREVVYERAKPGARARLHRRAARALEQSGAADASERLSALAHHFGRAVLGGDTRKAIHYAMRAGERALALYAFEDAAAHFDAALDALEAEDPLDVSRACRAAIAAARTHGLCGRGEPAIALAARAVELARKSRSARAFREAAVVASELQPSYARDPRSLALIDEALAGAGDRDLATRAQLVSLRAMMAFLDADRPAHERGSREALGLARRSGDAAALLEALRVRGFALNQPETEHEWRACIEERIALAAAQGDVLHDFGARQQRIELCIQTGDPAGIDADLRAMAEIAERVRSPKMAATLACTRAGLAIAAGPLGDARRHAERGFAIGRRVDFGEWWAIAQLQLGAIGVAEEQPPAGLAHEVQRGTVSHAQISLFRAGEIHLLCLDGAEDEARRRLLALARDGFAGLRRGHQLPDHAREPEPVLRRAADARGGRAARRAAPPPRGQDPHADVRVLRRLRLALPRHEPRVPPALEGGRRGVRDGARRGSRQRRARVGGADPRRLGAQPARARRRRGRAARALARRRRAVARRRARPAAPRARGARAARDRCVVSEGAPRAGALALRPWRRADRAAWLALFSDPDVVRFVGDGSVDSARDGAIFERLLALAIGPDERFAFVYAAELAGEIVGHVELKQTAHTRAGEWELVYVLARRAWGAGHGSALAAWAVAAAHAHGRRAIATVARENAASLHVLAKLGLAVEETLAGGETLLLRGPRPSA